MATRNIDLVDEIILKDDLYKHNTLLLKRGSVLNAYLLSKLNNFGVMQYRDEKTQEFVKSLTCEKEVLILHSENLQSIRTKEILKFAGFDADKILCVNSIKELTSSISVLGLKYIFVDSSFYNTELVNQIFLHTKNKQLKIFVMNCDETTKTSVRYNSEYQNVKFLFRPLANSYIKALLRLYS